MHDRQIWEEYRASVPLSHARLPPPEQSAADAALGVLIR